ncbi:MAG: HD domain-containing protein [Verrucomicrobiales bacterium]|nr:HD domain-containing protein [Verrucomicrobiales bacterium]
MNIVSIRELKQTVVEIPSEFTFHAQLDAANKKTTRGGNPYYELRFADAEETQVLRVWDNAPQFADCAQIQSGQFFAITGQFYKNVEHRGSVDAKEWRFEPLTDEDANRLLAGSESLQKKQAEDYDFIETTVKALSDPRLNALCNRLLDQFGERFRRTGAARDYHHARRGGLVEHVAQMMRAAVKICEAYPELNPDLLVSGVLFHDIGKLWENVFTEKGFTMPYSDVGELIGHIPMGMEIVNKLWRDLHDDESAGTDSWRDLEPASEQVRLHLLHLIASHHGEMAFGAPVVPKTPEAQALHYIDNLDAKMEMFDRGYLVAAQLSKNVFERVRPLPGRLVRPLGRFEGELDEPDSAIDEVEELAEGIEDATLPIPEPTEEELSAVDEDAGDGDEPF